VSSGNRNFVRLRSLIKAIGLQILLEPAPDIYHKSNISGGLSYGIHLPARGADAGFENDGHETTFVDYLRLCFQWGGFPGLEQYGEEEWRIARLEELRAGLLPI
jgi:hypothetical protein